MRRTPETRSHVPAFEPPGLLRQVGVDFEDSTILPGEPRETLEAAKRYRSTHPRCRFAALDS